METLSPKQLARLRKMKTRIEREGKGFKQYLESMGFEDENIKNIMAIAEIEIPPEESESSTRSDSEVIVKQREIYYEYDDKNQNRVLSLPKPKTHEEWVRGSHFIFLGMTRILTAKYTKEKIYSCVNCVPWIYARCTMIS